LILFQHLDLKFVALVRIVLKDSQSFFSTLGTLVLFSPTPRKRIKDGANCARPIAIASGAIFFPNQ
jgi:hypothetical protein